MDVLIVDDDPVVRRLLGTFLTSRGYEVTSVCDGAAAITAIRAGRPHVVLLDLQSSPLANWEVYGWLHRHGFSDVAVMVLTLGERQALADQVRPGKRDWESPFDLSALMKRITGVLGPSPVAADRMWSRPSQ